MINELKRDVQWCQIPQKEYNLTAYLILVLSPSIKCKQNLQNQSFDSRDSRDGWWTWRTKDILC